MRTIIRMMLLLCMAGMFVVGCDESDSESSRGSTQSGSWWESENTKLRRENERLRGELDSAKSERDTALSEQKKSKFWLEAILGIIVVAVTALLGWMGFSLLQKPKKLTSAEEKDACPRCGMKRTPGETVCRQCGTHF